MKKTTETTENKCNRDKIETYVDDTFGIVSTKPQNMWTKIREYVRNVENYYTNNQLINNISKTTVMIISKDNSIEKLTIELDKQNIGHSHDRQNFNNHPHPSQDLICHDLSIGTQDFHDHQTLTSAS